MDWKNQYCKNVSYLNQSIDSMQSLWKFQFFIEIKKILKCVCNHKKPQTAKHNSEKEQSRRHHTFWFQTILQNYSNQNRMVLAYKQTQRPMTQHWEPRNKPPRVWKMTQYLLSTNTWQECQKHVMGRKESLQPMVLGKLDIHMKKNEIRLLTPLTKSN